MPKSYDDPVKQKAREKQRNFIRRNMKFRRPQDIRVLCLPGAEQGGEEGLEILEVYDPLGISRGNITGLEIDPERAERLRQADMGIQIVNMSDIEFLQQAAERGRSWDVISLDYTSFFTDERAYAIDLIAGHHLLGTHGVLATNFSGYRESGLAKQDLRDDYLIIRELQSGSLPYIDDADLEGYDDDLALNEVRHIVISHRTIGSLSIGRGTLDPRALEPMGRSEELLEFMKQLPQDEIDGSFGSLEGRNIEERITRHASFQISREHRYWRAFSESTDEHYQGRLFWFLRLQPYFLEDVEFYRYVSNSGTPMFFNLFYADRHEKDLRPFHDFFSVEFPNNGERPVLYVLPQETTPKRRAQIKRKVEETVEKLEHRLTTYRKVKNMERTYLGSSFHPKRRERISKANAIDLLRAGCSPEEIADCYAGFTRGQLAAYKAHITMGTYDK